MRQAHRTLCFVHVLATCAACPERVLADVVEVQGDVDLSCHGQDRNGGCAGVHTPLRFRVRNTLNPVDATLKLQPPKNPFPLNRNTACLKPPTVPSLA